MIEILWLLFAASCGLVEGFLFHGRKPTITKPDEHVIFTIQRVVVGMMCVWSLYPDFQRMMIFTISAIATFSFIHDGTLYETRRYLSGGTIYPRGWTEESQTTDAKISMKFINRLWLFIGGVSLYIGYLIIKHL